VLVTDGVFSGDDADLRELFLALVQEKAKTSCGSRWSTTTTS
jgi:hypothetical protein